MAPSGQIIDHLHFLRHLNAKQSHAKAYDFGHALTERETHGAHVIVGLLQNLVIVVEAVELLGKVIALICDDADIVVCSSLSNSVAEGCQLLD